MWSLINIPRRIIIMWSLINLQRQIIIYVITNHHTKANHDAIEYISGEQWRITYVTKQSSCFDIPINVSGMSHSALIVSPKPVRYHISGLPATQGYGSLAFHRLDLSSDLFPLGYFSKSDDNKYLTWQFIILTHSVAVATVTCVVAGLIT